MWHEVWATATSSERLAFERTTKSALARILAHNTRDDAHDGYGMKADYSTPSRRLEDEHGAWTRAVIPGSEGHAHAVAAALHLSATDLRFGVQALANLGDVRSAPAVIRLAQHRKLSVRAFAVHALHALPCEDARRELLAVFINPDEDLKVRTAAVDALAAWPVQHLDYSDVLDSALRHLATNDGVEWDLCEVECTRGCATRSVSTCQNSCHKRCTDEQELEAAVVTLLNSTAWDDGGADSDADSDASTASAGHVAVRRLAALTGGSDKEHVPTHVAEARSRGERRLFTALSSLERTFAALKFQFREGFEDGWDIELGSPLAGAYAGAGIRNKIDINVGLFSGVFELDFGAFAMPYLLACCWIHPTLPSPSRQLGLVHDTSIRSEV